MEFYAIELTAMQFSQTSVPRMVTAFEEPVRPNEVGQPRFIMELPMNSLIARFVKDESGATAIEYALIAAGIGIAIIAGVNALGTAINSKFNVIKTSLN